MSLDINLTNVESTTNKKTTLTDNSDTFYPTQKAVKTAVDLKVDAVAGKGLSANDFTNTLKTKLDGIEAGAEVNVNADWNAVSGDAQILNKPTIPSIAGLATETFVTNITDNKVDKVTGSRLITSAESTVLGNTSGTNTGDETQASILSKLGVFYLPFTPSSAVTGTTSETQVAVVTIPANTIRSIDNLRIYTPVVKSGTTGICTVTYKLSTSATMPSGTTDRIAVSSGATGSLWIGMIRNASYNGGNLIIANSGTALVLDLAATAQAPTVTARNNAVTLYLYISITLGNASDSAYLSGGYITNN